METEGLVSCHGNPWLGSLAEMISITEEEGPRDGKVQDPMPQGASWAPAEF